VIEVEEAEEMPWSSCLLDECVVDEDDVDVAVVSPRHDSFVQSLLQQ